MVSEVERAKRVLVTLMRKLAALYSVTLSVTRDSTDVVLRTGYRKLCFLYVGSWCFRSLTAKPEFSLKKNEEFAASLL